MICFLTEKPSAARNFAKAFGGKSGNYKGEQFMIVNSVGHIMKFPTSPDELVNESQKQYYKHWKLTNLPWKESEFSWRRELDPSKKDVYDSIKSAVGKCDEIIIATDNDPSGEGTLLAAEILLTLDLTGKKLTRMFFEDETEGKLKQAYDERVIIPELVKDKDYIKADYRSRWDYLSMQFTRISTRVLYEHTGIQAVLRNGRLKSFMVAAVGDGLKALSEYTKVPYYQPAFKDENENWYTKKNPDLFKTPEEAAEIELKESPVKQESVKRKKTAPPKLLDLAGLASLLAPKGIKSSSVLSVYQKMYEDGVVSYPRTEDKEITPEQFAEYTPDIISRIARAVNADPKYITHFEARKSHVKAGGAHGANRPSALNVPSDLQQIESKYGFTGKEIYRLLALNFLSMYGEDYEYDEKTACIQDYPEYKSVIKVPVSLGFKAIFDDSEGDEEKEIREFGLIGTPAVKEFIRKAPPTPTLKWLVKNLEKYNVGTGATRTSTIAEITNQNTKFPLMIENKGKLTLTDYGNWNYLLLQHTLIGGSMLTERIQSEMADIAHDKANDISGMLQNMEKYVSEDLATMQSNASSLVDADGNPIKNYVGICPHCGGKVKNSKYGVWCTNKCGMNFNYFGRALSEEQVSNLLAGKEILLKDLVSKSGKKYDILIKSAGISEFKKKDGSTGYSLAFNSRFPSPAKQDKPVDENSEIKQEKQL